MQFVRCGACGAKALPAASRCPRCAQSLNLRDDRGALVPLMRCPSCDTFFPRAQGTCRWCEAPPASTSSRGLVRVGIFVAVIVGLGAFAWWYLAYGRAPATARPSPVRGDSAVGAAVSTAPPVADTVPVPATDIVAGDTLPPVVAAPPVPATVLPPPLPSAAIRWVPATARTWVNVHVAPDKAAATVGVVERDTQVELGDSQFGWRRIRSGPLTGWVDPRLFTIESLR